MRTAVVVTEGVATAAVAGVVVVIGDAVGFGVHEAPWLRLRSTATG